MHNSPIKICLSVDVEEDCPPYLNTHRGVNEGLVRLLELFEAEGVKGTFFVTGEIARTYPELIWEIVTKGHELGSHGLRHLPFDSLDADTAARDIRDSMSLLSPFFPVVSFRAPNLRFPEAYLEFLADSGFNIDSSQAKYKWSYYCNTVSTAIQRVPVSTTSSVLRLPDWIRLPILNALASPVVLFVHPWEFVDLRRERLRLDCRFRTGPVALECFKSVIQFFKKKQARFLTIGELGQLGAG